MTNLKLSACLTAKRKVPNRSLWGLHNATTFHTWGTTRAFNVTDGRNGHNDTFDELIGIWSALGDNNRRKFPRVADSAGVGFHRSDEEREQHEEARLSSRSPTLAHTRSCMNRSHSGVIRRNSWQKQGNKLIKESRNSPRRYYVWECEERPVTWLAPVSPPATTSLSGCGPSASWIIYLCTV